MKRLVILFVSISFIFLFISCNSDNTKNILSDNQVKDDLSKIPSDIEVVYNGGIADKEILKDLKQVEDQSTVIVEAVPKAVLGQEVDTEYDSNIDKVLPGGGYTKWEIEVTKVYKGDVKVKDKLILFHDYYLWTYSDGSKQLITTSSMKPAVKDKKYLMFLQFDEVNQCYWPTSDYLSMFAIPKDEIKTKVKNKTLKQSDLDVYNYEQLDNLIPVYSEVEQKYFE